MLRPGIAASALMAKYGQLLDRDSAYEKLARALQAGAEAAERERLEKEAAAREAAEAKERERLRLKLSVMPGRPHGPSRAPRNAGRSQWWSRSRVRALSSSSRVRRVRRSFAASSGRPAAAAEDRAWRPPRPTCRESQCTAIWCRTIT